MSAPEPSSPSRALFAGQYELLERVGAGGMGEVFVARAARGSVEMRLALKLLLPHLSQEPEFIQMFTDEARIAARMSHPNILPIYDVGFAEGRHFLAMPYVEGMSLADALAEAKRRDVEVPVPIWRLWAVGLCEALAHAHGTGGAGITRTPVIHRDVNPSNVLLSTAGAVLLTDFGIAKADDNLHHTRPGEVKGKFAYMAPEQMLNRDVGPPADVFGAAVTLYEAITRVSPFRRATQAETMDAVRTVKPPPARSLRPELSERLSQALARGMEADTRARFGSARELRDALLDGPVAHAHDLAAWLERVKPEGRAAAEPSGMGTRPLASAVPDAASRPTVREASAARPRPSKRLVGSAVVLLMALVSGVGYGLHARRPSVSRERPPAAPLIASGPESKAPAPTTVSTLPTQEETAPAPPAHHRAPHHPPAHASVSASNRELHPVAVGFLTADAAPWASVWMDGAELERTPLSRYPLPVGHHVLLFKNPELKRSERRVVDVKEGQTLTLKVELQGR